MMIQLLTYSAIAMFSSAMLLLAIVVRGDKNAIEEDLGPETKLEFELELESPDEVPEQAELIDTVMRIRPPDAVTVKKPTIKRKVFCSEEICPQLAAKTIGARVAKSGVFIRDLEDAVSKYIECYPNAKVFELAIPNSMMHIWSGIGKARKDPTEYRVQVVDGQPVACLERRFDQGVEEASAVVKRVDALCPKSSGQAALSPEQLRLIVKSGCEYVLLCVKSHVLAVPRPEKLLGALAAGKRLHVGEVKASLDFWNKWSIVAD